MNYKKALNNDEDIVKSKGAKIYGISLMLWLLFGLLFLAMAASMSTNMG